MFKIRSKYYDIFDYDFYVYIECWESKNDVFFLIFRDIKI